MLDVGQGLVGAGPYRAPRAALRCRPRSSGPARTAAAASSCRTCARPGCSRLDGLIVSHDDDDHWGGAASVLQALPVDWLLTSLPDLDPLVVQAGAGPTLRGGPAVGVGRRALRGAAPGARQLPGFRGQGKRPQLRARVSRRRRQAHPASGGHRAPHRRKHCCTRERDRLRADVLLAPHHGSRTSSTPGFRAARSIRESWCSPSATATASVIPTARWCERYADVGARIYRTDRDGAVTIAMRADGDDQRDAVSRGLSSLLADAARSGIRCRTPKNSEGERMKDEPDS